MKITHAKIKNFRALQSISIPLTQLSIILGENDAGKTSFFYALECFFGYKKMSDKKDWHKKNTGEPIETEEPIEITLSFKKMSHTKEFSDITKSDGSITIKGEFPFEESPKYTAVLDDSSEKPLTVQFMKTNFPNDLFVLVPVQRNIAEQYAMTEKALLGKLIRSHMREALEEKAMGNKESLTKIINDSIEPVREGIESLVREQLKNDSIKLSFDDIDLDLVKGVTISPRLSDEKVTDIDIHSRGAGTQNSLIIALFRYIDKSNKNRKKSIILCLEEPENSLHPKAQRQLLSVIQDISESTQVLVTTHSPIFIDRSHYEHNILFTRKFNGSTVARTFDTKFLHEVRDELGIRASDALLKGGGNCAILVEGKTEDEAFPVFMEMEGINDSELGISIIAMEGCEYKPAKRIINLLNSYDIPCIVVLDKDAEKTHNELKTDIKKGNLPNLKESYCLSKGTFEDYYTAEVIAEVINEHLSPNSPVTPSDIPEPRIGNDLNALLFNRNASNTGYFKTNLGIHGTKIMQKNNEPVPQELRDIFIRVKEIATGENP